MGLATTLVAVALFPSRAAAGCPQPVRDRYEPGEVVTIVGYARGCVAIAAESSVRENRPVYGFLQPDPCGHVEASRCRAVRSGYGPRVDLAGDVPLGRFVIDDSTHDWRGLRMSLTFTLPADLPRGAYVVAVCQDPCSDGLGEVGRWPIYVGVDLPPYWRPVRHWPLDDPAVQQLSDDALLLGHDGQAITAGEVRAGITMGNPAAARPDRHARAAPSVRTDDAPHHANGRSIWWIAVVALALLLVWAMSRVGSSRKQVHHRPDP
jgi:hypothetical protein